MHPYAYSFICKNHIHKYTHLRSDSGDVWSLLGGSEHVLAHMKPGDGQEMSW